MVVRLSDYESVPGKVTFALAFLLHHLSYVFETLYDGKMSYINSSVGLYSFSDLSWWSKGILWRAYGSNEHVLFLWFLPSYSLCQYFYWPRKYILYALRVVFLVNHSFCILYSVLASTKLQYCDNHLWKEWKLLNWSVCVSADLPAFSSLCGVECTQ